MVSDPTGWGGGRRYPHILWLQVGSPQKTTFSLNRAKLAFHDDCKRLGIGIRRLISLPKPSRQSQTGGRVRMAVPTAVFTGPNKARVTGLVPSRRVGFRPARPGWRWIRRPRPSIREVAGDQDSRMQFPINGAKWIDSMGGGMAWVLSGLSLLGTWKVENPSKSWVLGSKVCTTSSDWVALRPVGL